MSFMRAELTTRCQWVDVEARGETVTIGPDLLSLPDGPDGAELPSDVDLLSDEFLERFPTPTDAAEFRADLLSTVRDYHCGDSDSVSEITIREGYGVRSSAPGYLDCTDWSVYDSETEARDAYYEEILENDDSDPTALAYQTSRNPIARSPDLLRRFRWFMSETEHISNGRVSYAADLARAEDWFSDLANSHPARAEWVYDRDDDGESGAEWVLTLRVLDSDGDTLSTESLGGVDIGAECEPGRDIPYVRLTLAELALELYREFLPSN